MLVNMSNKTWNLDGKNKVVITNNNQINMLTFILYVTHAPNKIPIERNLTYSNNRNTNFVIAVDVFLNDFLVPN